MIRAWLEVLVPFLLPFAAYFAYLSVMRGRAPAQGGAVPGGDVDDEPGESKAGDGVAAAGGDDAAAPTREPPWLLLTAIGLVLVGAILFWTALTSGAGPDMAYQPGHFEDGHYIPPRFVPGTPLPPPPVSR